MCARCSRANIARRSRSRPPGRRAARRPQRCKHSMQRSKRCRRDCDSNSTGLTPRTRPLTWMGACGRWNRWMRCRLPFAPRGLNPLRRRRERSPRTPGLSRCARRGLPPRSRWRRRRIRVRRTNLLILLLVVSALCAVLSWLQLTSRRAFALARAEDLAVSRRYLSELSGLRDSPRHAATAPPNRAELNQKIRSAADVAGAGDRLTSVEPAQPIAVQNSDYSELPVVLHFDAMPLRDLAAFLADLAAND